MRYASCKNEAVGFYFLLTGVTDRKRRAVIQNIFLNGQNKKLRAWPAVLLIHRNAHGRIISPRV